MVAGDNDSAEGGVGSGSGVVPTGESEPGNDVIADDGVIAGGGSLGDSVTGDDGIRVDDTRVDDSLSETAVEQLPDDAGLTGASIFFAGGGDGVPTAGDHVMATAGVVGPVAGELVGASIFFAGGDSAPIPVAVPPPSVETIVRNVLVRTYGRYWRSDEVEVLNRVVDILNDSSLVDDPEFGAAVQVRAALWQRSAFGGPSAAATCNVFCAVGRQRELGPIARDALLYTQGLLTG